MPVEGRTHIPIVDHEKCNTCGVCVRCCPAEVIPEQRREESSLRGQVYKGVETAPSLGGGPVEMPPCQEACPIHQDIKQFIKLVASREYMEALKLIRKTNALPSVTGYICNHPCESACQRNLVEEPVAIKNLKRFVADFDNGRLRPPEIKKNGMKVSIIGSGPSGLAAAYELARDGFQVEIIEALPEPGGMLRWAIPPFRLPKDVLNRDIKYMERMGVVIKTGLRFGVDISLSDIRKGGTDAVIMAIGPHQCLKPRLTNERHTTRYIDCLTFLRKYTQGEQISLGETIVIGAGNTGIDSARSALRCGAKKVTIVDALSCEEIAADKDEIKEAQAEGIKVIYSVMPVSIINQGDKISGLECARAKLGKPDSSGRRKPVPVSGSKFVMPATSVISAVGQQPDLSWNQEGLPFSFSLKNTFIVDDSGLTNIEDVFAAGDAVNGSTTLIEAMASGKKVASSVERYLLNRK